MAEQDYCLQLKNICKEFSGVRVLHDVNLNVKKGEVHCICGENGAGKSTLMKILSGTYPHGEYSGEILLDGKAVTFSNIRQAEAAGIEIISQELELAPNMTVAENIFLGHEISDGLFVNDDEMSRRAEEVIRKFDLDIPANVKVETLGVGKQQLIAIAKALTKKAEILIFDEPTAALTESETGKLFNIIDDLKKDQVTCLYISHKLSEVMTIADTVSVLRDGMITISDDKKNFDENKIIKYMVGREITDLYPYKKREPGEVLIEVENLTVKNKVTGKPIIENISFQVRAGEIVGFAGLMGAGRTELMLAIDGALPGEKTGSVRVKGREVRIHNPKDAIQSGISMVVEDRKQSGLVLGMDVIKNTTLTNMELVSDKGFLNQAKEISETRKYSEKLSLKAPSLEIEVGRLSGGNQQKVVIAKTLITDPDILIMDEPTRGIDVGAKYDIYTIMNDIAESGSAILMVSSDLPEVLGMADRIIVMCEGHISGELQREEATQEKVMYLATKNSR